MKTNLLKPITVLAVAALSFASVRADDDSWDQDDDHERGGQIDGTEELEQEVRLIPTADAPAGASGKAEIEAENEEGVSTATLEIETEGLLVGTYTVSTVSLADGTTTELGTIDVTANHHEDADDDDDDQGDDADGVVEITRVESSDEGDDQGDDDDQGENETSGDGEFGNETSFAFPDGFNPLDIAAVEIADSNGVVVLRGDFTNLGKCRRGNLQINVQVMPGEAAPTAAGTAALRVRASRHVVRQKFLLTAENVPASSSLTVNVNGQPAGHVRTNRNGKVALRKLPHGVAAHRVYSVSFDDANGTRVLSARF